jgi:hypothetical protein
LLDRCGIGIDIAGQLLVTAGDDPGRMRSECSARRLDRHESFRGSQYASGDYGALLEAHGIVMSR